MAAEPTDIGVARPAPVLDQPLSAINLDQLNAARREADGEEITITLAGDVFVFPPELYFDALPFVDAITDPQPSLRAFKQAVEAFLAVILGDDRAAEFMAHRPTLPDMQAACTMLMRRYGVSRGGAPASKS